MKHGTHNAGKRRARRSLINVIVLLCVSSQILAAPVHAVIATAGHADTQTAAAECPAHVATAPEATKSESCECSGGACCQARIDRQPSLVASDIDTRPAESQSVLLTESAGIIKTLRFISGTQSRAPPAS